MSEHRGFVVQATYRTSGGRPVIHLHGRLDDGRTFLVRDSREIPRFWIRSADAARAAHAGAARLVPSSKRTFRGESVAAVEAVSPAELAALRDRLLAAGIPSYEADVRFPTRYLIDRGIRGAVAIRGESAPGEDAGVEFDDPEVAAGEDAPPLAWLAFDIETDPRARALLSVSLHGCGASEVLLLSPEVASCPAPALPFPSERELLAAFCRRVRELDPDVLTGWNVVDFDLAVLLRRAKELGVPLTLGRGPGETRIDPARFPRGASHAFVSGRMVLDGLALLRGSFVKMEEYSLDHVAREVLGKGKAFAGSGRADEILRAFREDRERFVAYNLADSRMVLEILDRLGLRQLVVERSLLTGMPLDRVGASIAAFDFLYLAELARRGIVAPTAAAAGAPGEPTTGGHVLDPEPGLYRNVLVFDFKSLYPSVIRTFEIDPLGRLPAPGPEDDPIVAPNGAAFRRERGILPGILDELVPRREAAKRAGDAVRSQAIKILMNSFYGVLGAPGCRFHDAELANAITGFGREVLLLAKGWFERAGLRVLYGDTDSLFVAAGEEDSGRARLRGEALAGELNRHLAEVVRARWRVESRLELQFETLYLRLLLPHLRGGTAGARKRYAGLVEEGGRRQVVFTGLEVVRRDWTELAKRVQREMYERLFDDRPVEEYLREVVRDLRAGRLDDALVYRKALRKELGEYVSTTPPHVVAARRMTSNPGRVVAYVVTSHGPEPAAERRGEIDHEHYLQKQVRPVAEPVLELLRLDFDRVVGDDAQLRLF